MKAGEINPSKAAELATNVYDVSSGDKDALELFLVDTIFSDLKSGKELLKAEVGGRIFRAADDMFGLCAVGGGAYSNDLFLIFRGTTKANNKADYVTDARIGVTRSKSGTPVHIGFNHAFSSMFEEIRDFVAQSKKTGRVHCIGHSLGGAVATLAADWVASLGVNSVSLYTFGQPRVGLLLFSTIFSKRIGSDNIHRVFHTTDPVPMVPVFPYTHSPLPGYGHRVESRQPILSGKAHGIANYVNSMTHHSDWSSLHSAAPLFTHEHAIKEWLKSKTSDNPNDSKTYEYLESALIWILAKALAGIAYNIQFAVMGVHSFVDKAAYILAKGIDIAHAASDYVILFLKKAMAVLGMSFQEGVTEFSKDFVRYILQSLIRQVNESAQRAIRGG